MPLTRDTFLAARTPRIRRVEVPELDGHVHVRMMSAAERDAFEAAHLKAKDANFRARLVVATACDESGVLLFQPADAAAVGNQPAALIEPIAKAAAEFNRLTDAEVEDLRKNS